MIKQHGGIFGRNPEFNNVTASTVTATNGVTDNTVVDVKYLVIGGGGGGRQNGGGGGGAGGYVCNVSGEFSGGLSPAQPPLTLKTEIAYTVTVAAGGGANADNASDSVFAHIVAIGGAGNTVAPPGKLVGGSGMGGSAARVGGIGASGQGFNGGDSLVLDIGGGGGGAGEPGEDNDSANEIAGDGGVGIASSITGSSVTRAGGGGGGYHAITGTAREGGDGGTGGGGDGGDYSATSPAKDGDAGDANTGGGGGGGGGRVGLTNGLGANGGSGVVIIRIPDTFAATFSGGVTSSSVTDGDFNVYTVTATSTTSETVTFSEA